MFRAKGFCVKGMFLMLFAYFLSAAALFEGDPVDRKRYIEWNPHFRLSWDNFNGKPSSGSKGDAGSVIAIETYPSVNNGKVHFQVYALFNREKSWYSDTSQSLLAHEQLHFDLAELYARKIRKKVSELSANGVKDFEVYNREVEKLLIQSNEADIRYDLETLHGGIKEKQLIWKGQVESGLLKLSSFSRK
jgi:hypothetical protein